MFDAASQTDAPTSGKLGILLVNLGTPDAATPSAVRTYLKEFLSDPRVIDSPRGLWLPILHLFILPFRPPRTAKSYAAIWNNRRDESPLKTITRSQAEKLAAWIRAGGLDSHGHRATAAHIAVAWGMRYGNPSIASAIEALKTYGCTRLLVLPLYPQYAKATWESVSDKVAQTLGESGWGPELWIAPAYYDNPTYLDSVAMSLRGALGRLSFKPDVILMSFHGLPKAQVEKGDPYEEQCLQTARLLRKILGLTAENCPASFQSRFGRGRWLQPYTSSMVKNLARKGVKSLVVIAPGFSADCIETLFELGVENREIFLKNGGENYALVPCLNDSLLGMMVIQDLVARGATGWI